ncbi:flavodoxin [Bifidobacterium margollesii]|uniref:Flavodoxin n=1 Tax=Bifidobacterium margollesii TaxID=2020964 RepID=A0A2N5J9U8_9BIFI|nr:flavodoxin [Bifidobacterium margollesii]PLS30978.1 flavodoxin [Bifidobacterium margollesii]
MSSVIVMFSRADENYEVGYVYEGNTAKVADAIAETTGAPIIEIRPEIPYPPTYSDTVDRVKEEMAEGAKAKIVVGFAGGNVEDGHQDGSTSGAAAESDVDAAFDAADTVYLGYPIWCGEMPLEVETFITGHDWHGKTILPFITHGGSGFAETPARLVMLTGATVLPGLAILGTDAQCRPDAVERAVADWLGQAR